MEGYWKKGMDKEAMENYESLLDRKFKMTPATCNVLLETLFKHDKLKEANDLWETMVDNHTPPSFIGINSESYNVMVNQCFKEGKFHEAIKVFHRQPRKNVQIDVGCFNNIIGKLCENGLLSEAEMLFQEMESKSVLPDVYTYTYLVDSCFKICRVDDTMQYFYKMADGREHGPKFNIGFFNRMFEGLTEAGRIDDALKVYGRMPDKEIKPNTTTFEILVKALCKERELDRTRDLVRDMSRGGVVAPPEFREFVSEIFKNADRHDEIEKAFEEKPEPPSQPRPDFRPRNSPQGLPGFASNQTQGSYTAQQGQAGYGSPRPFQPGNDASQVQQPEWMSPKSQQPVFGNQQVEKTEVGAPQCGLPSQGKQHGIALPQDQQAEFGTSLPYQHAVGASQVHQPDFRSAPPVQPGFGTRPQQPTDISHQAQHPRFGTSRPWQTAYDAQQVHHQAQQPENGTHQAQQPENGTHQAQQPGYDAPQAQQSGYGAYQPSRALLGTHEAPQSSLGSWSPQGGPKFATQTPQQDFNAQTPDDIAVKYSQHY